MLKNVKNTTFPGLLDLLAPHSCRGCGRIGTPLCERCKNYIISAHATYSPDLPSDFPAPIFVLGPRTGLVGSLVHDLKYNSVRALARPLAELLDATLPAFGGKVSIVPLPTSTKHIRARGLDHTLLIAKNLAKLRGDNYHVEQILVRAKNTAQVGASEAKRRTQAALAYGIKSVALDSRTTYLLLDDVWTTGASMTAALNCFNTLGPKKTHLVLLARN